MKAKSVIANLLLALLLVGCTDIPPGLQPVTEFQLEKYLGEWYEIARLDHSFERNLSNVTAQYSRRKDGGIEVVNRGFNEKSEKWKEITGRGYFIDKETVGSLKVTFFPPFYGGYHIVALDKQDYRYSMVVGPSRSYLWILSREKTLDPRILNELIAEAKQWGFNTDELIYVDQKAGK